VKTQVVEVDVEPSVLIWARKSLGMSIGEAAKDSHLEESLIEMLEKGSKRPEISMLKALASTYKRSTAALLLPRPPVEPPLPEDFRSLPREGSLPISKRTRLAMRRARRLQAIAGELRERPGMNLSKRLGEIHIGDDPEEVAIRLRNALGISYDVQHRWKDPTKAFDGWRTALEKLDILVLKIPMEMKEARAFSLIDRGIPVIAINSNDSPNGMIFSLLLQSPCWCNPRATRTSHETTIGEAY
jgi:transcriptional regulator with XRE-family HTH domain